MLLEGTEHALISNVNFTRCDSNGVFLSAYNKDTVIARSAFEWLGGTAIASQGMSKPAPQDSSTTPRVSTSSSQYIRKVGALDAGGDLGLCSNCTVAAAQAACDRLPVCRGFTFRSAVKVQRADAIAKVYLKAGAAGNTDAAWQSYLRQPPFPPVPMPRLPPNIGVDATAGNYPQGTIVQDVWVRDIGLLQKQSSAYFTAVSCCATIDGLIAFNGPRAMINVVRHSALQCASARPLWLL